MKKLVLGVLLLGSYVFVNAQSSTQSNVPVSAKVEQPAAQKADSAKKSSYVDMRYDELSQEVKNTINTYAKDYKMKQLQFNADKKKYKVTLIAKSDNAEKVIYIGKDGKEIVKDPKTTKTTK